MNKRAIFDHYSHILDSLLENNIASQFYFQDPFSWDEPFIYPYNPNWVLNCGASRVCIEDCNYDYIVKTDLADYRFCEDEVEIYSAAQKCGLAQYFTEVEYLGIYYKTYNFYDMEKIEVALDFDYYEFDSRFCECEEQEMLGEIHSITVALPLYAYRRATTHNYMEIYNELYNNKKKSHDEIIASSSKSPLCERNLAVGIEFIKMYGENEFNRISDFLRDNHINDLHCGNFGDVDGAFVCFDYAGFHNNYSEEGEEY